VAVVRLIVERDRGGEGVPALLLVGVDAAKEIERADALALFMAEAAASGELELVGQRVGALRVEAERIDA